MPGPLIDEPKKRSLLFKPLAGAVVALAIFTLGYGVGHGGFELPLKKAASTQNQQLPDQLNYDSVNQIYDSLRQNYDGKLEEAKLLDGIKDGLAKATGDPYTDYFNGKEAQDFANELSGTFEGIGAELGKDDKDNIIIISPIAGFPAEKAGLQPRDIIAQIDGTSTYDMSVSDAVSKIRGQKGTKVKLSIIRSGDPTEVEVERQQISIPSVKSKVENGIGILTISRFGEDTAELAEKAASDFKAANVKGVILDLRGDPGGILDAAVSVSSLWLPSGKTVLTERRGDVVIRTYTAKGNPILKDMPTRVLINEGSASASEITAGALKDNNAATLMGKKSFGKGSVQQPIQFKDGSMLKVTIARWFTPGGKNIDKSGLEPDKKVEITADQIKAGQDPQLDAAKAELGV